MPVYVLDYGRFDPVLKENPLNIFRFIRVGFVAVVSFSLLLGVITYFVGIRLTPISLLYRNRGSLIEGAVNSIRLCPVLLDFITILW